MLTEAQTSSYTAVLAGSKVPSKVSEVGQMEQVNTIRERFSRIKPLLNEVQRRYWVAIEALSLGRGGLSLVAAATGVSQPMIRRGLREVAHGALPPSQRQRRAGGGRKSLLARDAHLLDALLACITGEAPAPWPSALLWVASSTGQLAAKLTAAGHRISAQSVTTLLRQRGYTLRATRTIGTASAQRQYVERYRYVSSRVAQFGRCGQPVLYIRVYHRPGQTAGTRRTCADWASAELVLGAVRCWWRQHAPAELPMAREALLVLDAEIAVGQLALWRLELKQTAQLLGINVQLCTLPPAIHRFRSVQHELCFSSESADSWEEKQRYTAEVNRLGESAVGAPVALRQQLYRTCYPKGLITSGGSQWSLCALK